jgi:hypothetical protein
MLEYFWFRQGGINRLEFVLGVTMPHILPPTYTGERALPTVVLVGLTSGVATGLATHSLLCGLILGVSVFGFCNFLFNLANLVADANKKN